MPHTNRRRHTDKHMHVCVNRWMGVNVKRLWGTVKVLVKYCMSWVFSLSIYTHTYVWYVSGDEWHWWRLHTAGDSKEASCFSQHRNSTIIITHSRSLCHDLHLLLIYDTALLSHFPPCCVSAWAPALIHSSNILYTFWPPLAGSRTSRSLTAVTWKSRRQIIASSRLRLDKWRLCNILGLI